MRRVPPKLVSEVFGVSNVVLPDSYVDRGDLDGEITRLLQRPNHVALRGVSKAGKSWLRQSLIPGAIVIQCRLGKTILDIYREALGELDIRLEISASQTSTLSGTVEASGEVGIKLIAKVMAKLGLTSTKSGSSTTESFSQSINDLRFIADLILESGRRLVIEDFHYLSIDERTKFAFDMKALWDFGVFIVVVGVWSDQNLFLHLNTDLTGRVREVSVVWSDADLRRIFARGGDALNLAFSDAVQNRAVSDSYGNCGILQRLIVDTLDRLGVTGAADHLVHVDDVAALEHAEVFYAEELNSVYQTFASRVATGIRTRQNSTAIYAHAMAAVLGASDEDLITGVSIDRIYAEAHARESRIQKGNLRNALSRIEGMQVDSAGRGLVLSNSEGHVRVVDRQLLLYRKYSTVSWPWDDLIADAEQRGGGYSDDA
jgi:hypothetical protein